MPTPASIAHALSLVDSLLDSDVSSPWRFPKVDFAVRLRAIINKPMLINQGSINVCGPASFFVAWCSADPVGFCKYAIQMYSDGQGSIGDLVVKAGNNLVSQDYLTLQKRFSIQCPSCDWMVMSSLRDSENLILDFNGTPEEDVSGITTPGEIEKWTRSTKVFKRVSNQANLATTPGIDHAIGLSPAEDTFVIMLINATMLPQSGSDKFSSLARFFPNHFILLYSRVEVIDSCLRFDFWSWGRADSKSVP